ncbi:homoserine dehydrogenase [Lysinibacillus contaminans]|uniref:homoserine dehydrogenase n=1 Tax=Lysinibacillus contaminans TaxID=1293441 RepID=UPI0009E96988|nr:homoserine dehydrogenase [Lysinibacillus contaminans]
MKKSKYRILNNTLVEIAQSREFTAKDDLDAKFDEQGSIVLVSDRAGAGLTLSIVKIDDAIRFLVKWDDSEEYFKGWNMAWEEFLWCLDVATTPEEAEVEAEVETEAEAETETKVEAEAETETTN